MSDRESGPGRVLGERLRLGAGFGAGDRDQVLELLGPLGRHLAHWDPDRVDLEISVKNRGGPEQTVTLEAWLPRWPSLVAHSAERELDHAVTSARKEMIRLIEDKKARRDPRKARGPRPGSGW